MRAILPPSTTMMVLRRIWPLPSRIVAAFKTMGCSWPLATFVRSGAAKRKTAKTNRKDLGISTPSEFERSFQNALGSTWVYREIESYARVAHKRTEAKREWEIRCHAPALCLYTLK